MWELWGERNSGARDIWVKMYDEERKELISYLNKRGKVHKDLAYLLGYDFNRDRVGYRILIEYMYTTGLSERI